MADATPEMDQRPRPGTGDALLAIDVQVDFLPGRPLAVPDGDAVVEPINRLSDAVDHVILTQDWHPESHASFASSQPGRRPFETVDFPYGSQTLWPDHCVIGSPGAAFAPGLRTDRAEMIVRKGFRREIDSYSAFFENDGSTPTGLAGALRERGIRRIFFAGLATDFCVGWSVRDARRCGFAAVLVEDACRAIDLDGSLAASLKAMAAAGATRCTVADMLR